MTSYRGRVLEVVEGKALFRMRSPHGYEYNGEAPFSMFSEVGVTVGGVFDCEVDGRSVKITSVSDDFQLWGEVTENVKALLKDYNPKPDY